MSDDDTAAAPPRRRKPEEPQPEQPSGYRSTRRRSKVAKKSRQAARVERIRAVFRGATKSAGRLVTLVAGALAAGIAVALVVFLLLNGVNTAARWYAKRRAEEAARVAAREKLKENVLVIGVRDKTATGFLAMRVDRKGGRVFGLAIPDGAFMEVPGQGFERVGDSYKAGAKVSLAAVSNYLSVPFETYIVVADETYKDALKQQSVTGLMHGVAATNLGKAESQELAKVLAGIAPKNVGLAPLPVRSVSLGNLQYYEPQRDQIADLLYSWWGVRMGVGKQPMRLIIYNGAGSPGIAGVAAQELIKSGFRVVDTSNADHFGYAKTQIVLFRGTAEDGRRIRDILGVGEVSTKSSDQNITDAVVIIGKDFAPRPSG